MSTGTGVKAPFQVNISGSLDASGNACVAGSAIRVVSGDSMNPAVLGYVQISPSASAASAPDVIVRYITAAQAGLASAGKVVVQAHTSTTSQFAVLGMRVIKSTGLSGNSGDRLLSLSDGTIVYNSTGVTAALLGTPITTRPAGTGNPDVATSVNPSASTAGADIYLQYISGTTDYNAGSVVVEVTLAQVTA